MNFTVHFAHNVQKPSVHYWHCQRAHEHMSMLAPPPHTHTDVSYLIHCATQWLSCMAGLRSAFSGPPCSMSTTWLLC